jgi:hypothetical protein
VLIDQRDLEAASQAIAGMAHDPEVLPTTHPLDDLQHKHRCGHERSPNRDIDQTSMLQGIQPRPLVILCPFASRIEAG